MADQKTFLPSHRFSPCYIQDSFSSYKIFLPEDLTVGAITHAILNTVSGKGWFHSRMTRRAPASTVCMQLRQGACPHFIYLSLKEY